MTTPFLNLKVRFFASVSRFSSIHPCGLIAASICFSACPLNGDLNPDAGNGAGYCVTDDDCGSGQRCLNNHCEARPLVCSIDSDCRPDEVCDNGTCVENCAVTNCSDPSGDGGGVDPTDSGGTDSGDDHDAGAELDAGTISDADSGTPPVMDSGTPPIMDSGSPPIMDSGPALDSGAPSPDAGSVVDSGTNTSVPDAGGSDADGGGGSPSTDAGTGEPFSSTACELPVTYERIGHSAGSLDFEHVSWAPSGAYALVIGYYPAKLYRYQPSDNSLTLIGEGSGEQWNVVRFAPDGSYALIGGNKTGSTSTPVLYRVLDDGTFDTMSTTGFFSGSRIQDIQPRPGYDTFGVLSDNGSGNTASIAYAHELSTNTSTTDITTAYYNGVNISQGASSLAWGENLGSQIALGVSRYLELLYLDPSLSSGQLSLQSHGNVGNLKKVIFHPDRQQAWVLQWSGSGKVYAWEGSLHTNNDDEFGFSGYSMWDFSTTEDGHWKIFIGKNGNIWFSDSPFRPITANMFYNEPIPGFDDYPWSGDSNTDLHEAAFKPSSCEGLIVGEATQSQGLLIRFSLVEK